MGQWPGRTADYANLNSLKSKRTYHNQSEYKSELRTFSSRQIKHSKCKYARQWITNIYIYIKPFRCHFAIAAHTGDRRQATDNALLHTTTTTTTSLTVWLKMNIIKWFHFFYFFFCCVYKLHAEKNTIFPWKMCASHTQKMVSIMGAEYPQMSIARSLEHDASLMRATVLLLMCLFKI